MDKVKYSELIEVHNVVYVLEVMESFEFKFRKNTPILDSMGYETCPYARVAMGQHVAVPLFRKIIKSYKNYVDRVKPPMIWFDVGFDPSRERLYLRFAKKLEGHGYKLHHDPSDPGKYYLFRK